MKLRQGEIKKTMKGILAGAFLLAAGSAAVFAVGTETELKQPSGSRQKTETGLTKKTMAAWHPAGRRLAVSGMTWMRKMGCGTAIRPWMRLPSAIWWRMR